MARTLPKDEIYQFLDTNGDGTGTKNAIGDYSANPTTFFFEAQDNVFLHELIITIIDGSTMKADEYANLGMPLANGYNIVVNEGAPGVGKLAMRTTDEIAIKTNGSFARYSFTVDIKSWGNPPKDDILSATLSFDKTGSPLYLLKGWSLSITFNDDFTDLIEHFFMIQGHKP